MRQSSAMSHDAPFLTADLPGIGGRIREQTHDFVVEELPLYPAVGVGDHVHFEIQKVGIPTDEAVRRVARALGVKPQAIGFAGLKDTRAIARQRFSVEHVDEEAIRRLEVRDVEVLDARRHGNKLRIGHLAGNRFLIRVRGVAPDAADAARAVLDRLAKDGMPNLYGSQRFGSKGNSWEVGRALIRGEPEAAVAALLDPGGDREKDERLRRARGHWADGDLEGAIHWFPPGYRTERIVLNALLQGAPAAQAVRRIPKRMLKLLVSAYQSWLFNRLLVTRMPDLGKLEEGDLAYLHDRGASFTVIDPEAEQPRADRMEISPSGPLYGRKVTLAKGAPGERERRVLEEEGLAKGDFRIPGARLSGERRPFRVPIGEPSVRQEGEDAILLSFTLPKGCFATTALREVMKVDDPVRTAPGYHDAAPEEEEA